MINTFKKISRPLLTTALLCISTITLASGRYPTDSFSVPEGAYSATHVDDINDITVMRFSGNYDMELQDGVYNRGARATIAREFYEHHPDNYDFIVTFTSFEFETGDAVAFYSGVQNDVQGIGLDIFDNSSIYGSNSKLQGMIEMAATSRYNLDPFSPEFDWPLNILAHETLHRWGSFVRVLDDEGNLSERLLGRDGAHWNFFLDTDASVELGHDWREEADGSFRAVSARHFYSPLDLYLMGFYSPEEVPDFRLITPFNSPYLPTDIPIQGVTTEGTSENISINDIIAAEGARVPAAADSQKEFRFAFVYVVGENEEIDPTVIANLNSLRRAFMERFSIMTGGRGIAHIYPEAMPVEGAGQADRVNADDNDIIRIESADVDDALDWLNDERSLISTSWQDLRKTRVRDTATVLTTLNELDADFNRYGRGIAWLRGRGLDSTDSLARTLNVFGAATPELIQQLLEGQNTDGGWGLKPNLLSSVLDTALSVEALANNNAAAQAVSQGVAFLLDHQLSSGAWSELDGSQANLQVTMAALKALLAAGDSSAALESGLVWLSQQQNTDGGLGRPASTVHETAEAILIIVQSQRELLDFNRSDAANYISALQRESGNWEGSVYTTAVAARSLRSLARANLQVSAFSTQDLGRRDGERVTLSVRVLNDSPFTTREASVNVFVDEPTSGGTPLFTPVTVPILGPGAAFDFNFTWDTLNFEGEQELYAQVVAHPDDIERSITDNTRLLSYAVAAAPDEADLELNTVDILVTPNAPSALPTQLAFSAILRNVGRTDASQTVVELWRNEVGGSGELLATDTVDVLARTSVAANFVAPFNAPGETTFIVVADPANQITEEDESNNTAQRAVQSQDSLDLEVLSADLSAAPQPGIVYDDLNITVTVRNRGTLSSPNASLVVSAVNTDGTTEIVSSEIALTAGEVRTLTIPWRVNFAGNSTIRVNLDRDNLITESDETNNVATLDVVTQQLVGTNVSVVSDDLSFNPDPANEGMGVTINATIRNEGTTAVSGVPVLFFNGNPAAGGTQIGDTVFISNIASGDSVTLSHVWPEIVGTADRFVFVSIDPDGTLGEYDLTDNIAFEELEVRSLPDLVVANGSIQLDPQFPNIGDTATVTVQVNNSGTQAADNILVRAYRGLPDQGGVEIGSGYTIPSLAGSSSASISFQMDFLQQGQETIYVEVNPLASILESDRTNNSASRLVAIQDSSFYVSDRYFSPNGDGVQDESRYFFRADDTVVDVVVLDVANRELRAFAAESDITAGVVAWNGRSSAGGIVNDGDYAFALKHESGAYSGATRVTLDTNRSSIAEAFDTQYELRNNLSCLIGDQAEIGQSDRLRGVDTDQYGNVIYSRDEEWMFFVSKTSREFIDGQWVEIGPYRNGLYRARRDGSDITLIDDLSSIVDDTTRGFPGILEIAVNDDSTRLALAYTNLSSAPADLYEVNLNVAGSFRFVGQMTDANPEFKRFAFLPGTSNLLTLTADPQSTEIDLDLNTWRLTDASPTPALLARVHIEPEDAEDPRNLGHRLYQYALDFNADASVVSVFASPSLITSRTYYDYQTAFLRDNHHLQIVDVATGNITPIAGNPTAYSWSPEGGRIAVGDATRGAVDIYTQSGVLIQSAPFNKQFTLTDDTSYIGNTLPVAYRSESAILGKYAGIDWSPDGLELAFVFESYAEDFIVDQIINEIEQQNGGYGQAVPEDFDFSSFQLDIHHGIYSLDTRSGTVQQHAELEPFRDFLPFWLDFDPYLFDFDTLEKNEFGMREAASGLPIIPWTPTSLLSISNSDLLPKGFRWIPGSRAVLVTTQSSEDPINVIGFDPSIVSRNIFAQDTINRDFPPTLSPSGRYVTFDSSSGIDACADQGPNDFGLREVRSLLNLETDLRLVRSPRSGGILIQGTAADRNFASVSFEYANVNAPDTWFTVAPPTTDSFIDDQITTWIPPAEGSYFVRMIARDLAGNTRTRMSRTSLSDRPSITQLYRSPSYISPNSDGSQDAVEIHFRVVEPVNLDVEILTQEGVPVRSFTQSYSAIGAEEVIVWDGRDESGQVVSDGAYTIRIQNYELFVTIDTTFPSILDGTTRWARNHRLKSPPHPAFVDVYSFNDSLVFSATDEQSVPEVAVEYRLSNSAIWTESRWRGVEIQNFVEYAHPHSLEEWKSGEFRVVAQDQAGNETVYLIDPSVKLDQLAIDAFYTFDVGSNGGGRDFLSEPDRLFFDANDRHPIEPHEPYRPLEPLLLHPESPPGPEFIFPQGEGVVLTLQQSIVSSIQSIEFVYAQEGRFSPINTAEVGLGYLTKDCYTDRNVSLSTIQNGPSCYRPYEEGSVFGEELGSSVAIRLDVGALSLEPGQYFGYFRVTGSASEVYTTNNFAFETGMVVSINSSPVLYENSRSVLVRTSRVDSDEVLSMTISVAPRPTIKGEEEDVIAFGTILLEEDDNPPGFKRISDGELEFYLPAPFSPCEEYDVTATLRLLDGRVRTEESVVVAPCSEVVYYPTPVFPDSCGLPATHEVNVNFRIDTTPFDTGADATGLREVSVYRRVGDSIVDTYVNLISPDYDGFDEGTRTYFLSGSFQLDTSAIPEDQDSFFLRVVDVADNVIEIPLDIPIVQSEPELDVTYPLDGQRYCATEYADDFYGLEMQGRSVSEGRHTYELLKNQPEGLPPSDNFCNPTFYDELLWDQLPDLPNLDDPTCSVPNVSTLDGQRVEPGTMIYNEVTNESRVIGTLGIIGFPSRTSDTYELTLEQFNWAGARVCRTLEIEVDAGIEELTISERFASQIDRSSGFNIYSPNGDGLYDAIEFDYGIGEPATVSLTVFSDDYLGLDSNGDPLFSESDLGVVVLDRLSVTAGEQVLSWSGAASEPDGYYRLVFTTTDSCGFTSEDIFYVKLDTTPPIPSIISPVASDILGVVAEVSGVVTDIHRANYTLSVGQQGGEYAAVSSGAFSPGELAKILGSWNNFGLSGEWNLLLEASDIVGNRASTSVTVTLPQRAGLIESLDTDDEYLSPNGDDVLDDSVIRVRYAANATATIEIRSNGVTVATIASDVPVSAGDSVYRWNGQAADGTLVQDGRYQVWVRATSSISSTIVQEEYVSIELDNQAPTISVLDAVDGVFGVSDLQTTPSLLGSVQDENFVDYGVSVISTPAGLSSISIGGGVAAPVTFLAPLSTSTFSAQGSYRVSVQASDRAGNTSTFDFDLLLDSVAPVINVSSPAQAPIISNDELQLEVEGNIVEENIANYTVTLNDSSDTEVFRQVSTSLPTTNVLSSIPVSDLSDGSYTLDIEALDRGGLSDSFELAVTMDSTDPTIIFASTLRVSAPTDILATVSDANFQQYELSLASGHDESAAVYSLVTLNNRAVSGGSVFNWQNLPSDGNYLLRLSALDRAGNDAEAISQVIVDTVPPIAPTITSSEFDRDNEQIEVVWEALDDPSLQGYYVYRNGNRVTPTPITSLNYIDSSVVEGIYEYGVSGVDLGDLEGPQATASLTVDITPPVVSFTSPSANETVNGVASLVGTAFSPGDFGLYQIFATQEGSSEQTQIFSSTLAVNNAELAQLNTQQLIEGQRYTLTLRAEDTNGNSDEVSVEVVIDNAPPAAPTGLAALLSGEDVQLTWDVSTEPDLRGYLLFRNESLANTSGPVVGDLAPFLIDQESYLDLAVVDGDHDYFVVAMDTAGNISEPSNLAEILIDRRAPHADFVGLVGGQEFDLTLFIDSTVADLDVADVAFEYRVVGDTAWQSIVIDRAEPYSYQWDTSSLSFGDVEIRAVASDVSGNIDPNPPVLDLLKRDLTRPEPPENLALSVNGGTVALTWQASPSADVSEYRVFRREGAADQWLQINTETIIGTTFDDIDLDDSQYEYHVVAVDAAGNISEPTDSENATVFTPTVQIPFSPTMADTIILSGRSEPFAFMSVEFTPDGAAPIEFTGVADAEGVFVLPTHTLDLGRTNYTLSSMNGDGHIGKDVVGTIRRSLAPAQVTNAVATLSADESVVNVVWDPNVEADVVGYHIYREGEPISPRVATEVTGESDSSASSLYPLSALTDDNTTTYWGPDSVPQYLELVSDSLAWITALDVRWTSSSYAATDFEIQAWDGGGYFTVVHVQTDDFITAQSYAFGSPYYTDRLRIKFNQTRRNVGTRPLRLAEVDVTSISLSDAVSFFSDAPDDGFFNYQVSAVNDSGFAGERSALTQVGFGDVVAPEAVQLSGTVSGSDTTLTWTASSSPDVDSYRLYRDGVLISIQSASSSLSYVDADLGNGTYIYTVEPVDAVENVGDVSNSLGLTVAVPLLAAPVNLVATVDGQTGNIGLTWEAGPGSAPDAYQLYRSIEGDNAYQAIYLGAVPNYLDAAVIANQTYQYYAVSLDTLDNASAASNIAVATSVDDVAPASPEIFFASTRQSALVTLRNQVDVLGNAEPGSTVYLSNNGSVNTSVSLSAEPELSQSTGNIVRQIAESSSGDIAALMRSSTTFRYGVYVLIDGNWILVIDEGDLSMSLNGIAWVENDIVAFSNSGQVVSIDIDSGQATTLPPWSSNFGFVRKMLGFEESRNAILLSGSTSSISGLLEYRLDTGEVSQFGAVCCLGEVSLSPDLSQAAYAVNFNSSNRRLYLYDLASGAEQTFDITSGFTSTSGVESPSWSDDGRRLLITVRGAGGFDEIGVFDTQTETFTSLVSDAGWHLTQASWSPDSSAIVYSAHGGGNTEMREFDLSSGTSNVVQATSSTQRLVGPVWSQQNILAYGQNSVGVSSYKKAGSFIFRSQNLAVGSNDFFATARDQAANESNASDQISATRNLPDRADLVNSFSLSPLIPRVNDGATVNVVVENIGSVESDATQLSVRFQLNGAISTIVDNFNVPSLLPGSSISVPLNWVPNEAGSGELVAIIDTQNVVVESEERNNNFVSAVDVVSESVPITALNLNQTVVGANRVLSGAWRLTNAGPTFSGNAILRILDGQGYEVSTLQTQPFVNVAHGETFEFGFDWNSGSTYAGQYAVVLEFVNTTTGTSSEQTAGFSIAPDVRIVAGVVSDLPSYGSNSDVRVSATVASVASNAVYEGGTATIRITNATGIELHSQQTDVGALVQGAQALITSDWNSSNYAPGTYQVLFDLVPDNQDNTTVNAVAQFEIRQGAPVLSGEFTESRFAVDRGQAGIVSFGVDNLGNSNLEGVVLTVSLVDIASGALLRSSAITNSISTTLPLETELNLDTSGYGVGEYGLRLAYQATVLGNTYQGTLAQSVLAIEDVLPPNVTILTPESGAVVNSLRQVGTIEARDDDGRVEAVIYTLNGGPERQASIAVDQGAGYRVNLSELSDGEHRLSVVSSDTANNTSDPEEVTFIVDNTAPSIALAGITDGSYYSAAVSPVVTVTDANSVNATLLLNGEAYTSSAPISADGEYTLSVVATDEANNIANRLAMFSIDTVSAVINVEGVTDGAAYNIPVTPVVTITEENLVSSTITLDGVPFSSGETVSSEGAHTLFVSVEDLAGNLAESTISFELDFTAPDVPTVISPVHNSTVSTTEVDVVGQSEADALIAVQLNGGAVISTLADASGDFTIPNFVLVNGANTLLVTAQDRAGNVSAPATVVVNSSSTVSVTANLSLDQSSHVLVYAPPSDESIHPTCYETGTSAMLPGYTECLQNVEATVARLMSVYDQLNVDYLVVRDSLSFLTALRSDLYNVVNVMNLHSTHALPLDLTGDIYFELSARVSGGTGLIFLSTRDDGGHFGFYGLTGAEFDNALPGPATVTLNSSIVSGGANWDVSQYGLKVRASEGTSAGSLSFECSWGPECYDYSPLIMYSYGSGNTAMIPFNLVEVHNQAGFNEFVSNLIQYVTPTQVETLSSTFVRTSIDIDGEYSGAGLIVEQSHSDELEVHHVFDGSITDQVATWVLSDFTDGVSVSGHLYIENAVSNHIITASGYDGIVAPGSDVFDDSLAFSTVLTVEQRELEVLSLIRSISTTDEKVAEHLATADYFMVEAIDASLDTESGIEQAIFNLVASIEQLRQSGVAPNAMVEASRLLRSYQALSIRNQP